VTIVMSDRGIPATYRHMHGFGSHTFSFINAANERFWVKFHFKTQQGIRNLSDAEAAERIGNDRETHQRDLYDAIEKRDFPRWVMKIQVMPEKDAANVPYHPFDLTKVWPHGAYPLTDVGVLELDRNPENFFAEVEQSAFNPANVVPGIGFSPDKMLQARLFSYGDAQRYRLGVNHHQIPVNAARCPVHGYHRDGAMRVDGNYGSTLGYEPNSYGEWAEQPDFREPPLSIEGAADHWNQRVDTDYYSLSAVDKGPSLSHPAGCKLDSAFETKTAGTEICVFARCKNTTENTVTGCTEGKAATSENGWNGCCGTKAVPDLDCSGFTDNDSSDFLIRIKPTNNANACLPYKFEYRY